MKILHINTKSNGGGTASIVNMLFYGMDKYNDVESKLVYGREGYEGEDNKIYVGNKLSKYFTYISSTLLGIEKPYVDYKMLREIIRECDIVHIHNLHGYYIDYKRLINIIIEENKIIVKTFHDLWWITGRCASPHDYIECNEWINGCKECNYKNYYPRGVLTKEGIEWENKKNLFLSIPKDKIVYVAPSRWVRNNVKKSFIHDYDVRVISNSIEDIKCNKISIRELRCKYGIDEDEFVCCMIAANPKAKKKGITDFIYNIPKINRKVKIILIGEKIEELNQRNIIQLGYLNDKRTINDIFQLSDLFINPSYVETFSLSTLEAMANGTPVLAFNIGPINELLSKGGGFRVEKGNFDLMIEKLNYLYENKNILREEGKKAIKIYRDYFTKERIVNEYYLLYKNLISRGNHNEFSR